MKKIILSTLASAVILFLWSGMTQMLPWGIPSTQNVRIQTEKMAQAEEVPNLVTLPEGSLITNQFEEQFLHKISTLSTDDTFSWIITQPLQTDYTGYFIKEFISQLLVGLLLAFLLHHTVQLSLTSRMSVVIIAALSAVIATYGQLMNWWALPASYGVGVGINLIIGWAIAAFISARFIITSKNQTK